MNHFLLNKEVIVVGSTYWNMAYGRDAGDVLNDAEGMANMRNLVQNMAFVLKKSDRRGDGEGAEGGCPPPCFSSVSILFSAWRAQSRFQLSAFSA